MSYIYTRSIALTIIPTLYEGYIVSVHKMVIENRPFDPGSIQGSHRPISFIRIKHRTRANDFFWNWVQYSSQKPYYKWNRVSTSNERVWCTTQLAKLSFNHSIGKSWKTSAVSTTVWMAETQLSKLRGKNWKTSAVSTTDWMVETQLCILKASVEQHVVEVTAKRRLFFVTSSVTPIPTLKMV